MKIQYKIVIPFTLLFVVATLVTTLVSISLMARNQENRVRTQLEQATQMISRADFALNSTILENLKTVLGADIITYRRDGTIFATTLSASPDTDLTKTVLDREISGEAFELRELEIGGRPYRIGYREMASRPDTWIAVIVDTSDIAGTQNTIANSLLLITAVIVALMAFTSQLIARSVTAPVLRLVDFTRKVAAGQRSEKAVVSTGDEISVLAQAFNEMVAQLHRSEEKLLQSEKLAVTGLLAARVAHEVRNPLSAIKMQAQLLRSKLSSNKEEKQLLSSILREIERVEWVVRGMLDLASPQQLQLDKERVSEVLDEVLELTEAQLRHRKIVVKKNYEDIPPAMLDRNRLKLAFLNLIMNASEAMTNGGTLEVLVRAAAKDSMIVEIRDDGEGIDPAVKHRLFDPFVTTKREGVGLGLVNTRNIIERHGGTIELMPNEDRGTRAIIHLPAKTETGLEQVHG